MSAYILVIWTVVAMKHGYADQYDWRPIGEFQSLNLCHDAARELNLNVKNFRCVRSK